MYNPFQPYIPQLVVCCGTCNNNTIDLSKFNCCQVNYQLNDLISNSVWYGAADQMNNCTRYKVQYRAIDPATYQYTIFDDYLGITQVFDHTKLDTKDLPEDTFLQMLNESAIIDDRLSLAQLSMFAEYFPKPGINKIDNGYDVYSNDRAILNIRYETILNYVPTTPEAIDYVPVVSVFGEPTDTELVRFFKRYEKQGIVFYQAAVETDNGLTKITIVGSKEITDHGILCVTITINDLILDEATFELYRQLMINPQIKTCE